jgi:hypothetical protein
MPKPTWLGNVYYAMQGDWNMAKPTLNNGFDLTFEALEKM